MERREGGYRQVVDGCRGGLAWPGQAIGAPAAANCLFAAPCIIVFGWCWLSAVSDVLGQKWTLKRSPSFFFWLGKMLLFFKFVRCL